MDIVVDRIMHDDFADHVNYQQRNKKLQLNTKSKCLEQKKK